MKARGSSFLQGKLWQTLVTLGIVHVPAGAHACSACMGDPNSQAASAINAAIFLMLGCIGGVLGLLSAFGFYLYRRARLPLPPHVELAEMIGTEPK